MIGGFISKHWRGEFPLSVSFWLIFVLLTLAYQHLEQLLPGLLIEHPTGYMSLSIVCLIAIRFVVYPWQIVGLLRSADKHYLTYDRPIIRYGVQGCVVISFAFTIVHVIAVAQSLAAYQQAIANKAIRSVSLYSLQILDHSRLLQLDGTLDFGVVESVEGALLEHPGITGIILNSDGGQIYEGRGLSRLIDRHRLDTYSFEGCSSACATAFIGGHRRYLGEGARLGFHQYRFESDHIDQFKQFYDVEAEERRDFEVFKSKNLSESFLEQVFATPHHQTWFPDIQTLIEAGVIHGVVDPREVLAGD